MPSNKNSSSFTLDPQVGLITALVTECQVCESFTPDPGSTKIKVPAFLPFRAIWDTGATATVITQNIVDQCGLKPIGVTQVHGVHGVEDSEVYLINVGLPNQVAFANIRVTKGKLPEVDMLIGMDIITTGDFSVTNKDGNTMFSFRVPSLHHVDYVKEYFKQKKKNKRGYGTNKPKKKRRRR